MSNERIYSWANLEEQVQRWREAGKRIVQCHGVFDLLHIGHIRYFQKARQLGDVLIVTMTPDRFVNKGPHRPVFTETLRLEAVASLECVDAVALNTWPTAREAIVALKPAFYAKGAEFRDNKTPELLLEEEAAAGAGTQVAFIDELTSSSTLLINRYLSVFDEPVEMYLQQLRQRFPSSRALEPLQSMSNKRLLVVGESIIDEYYSCVTIGQSMKAPIVSTRYESHRRFASGAAGVANHLAAFCKEVDLVTMVGDQDNEEEWLAKRLRDNVRLTAIRKKDSPTIVKRRYREPYFDIPLFAVNFLNDTPLAAYQTGELTETLREHSLGVDGIVVADYGHGFLVPETIRFLTSSSTFLAVSTQANAANYGLHTISKYPRADYFSLAHRELELDARSLDDDVEQKLRRITHRMGSCIGTVTLGRNGCLCVTNTGDSYSAPAVARRVVDRIGAGDAFFAITTLCAMAKAPLEILAFLGNVAGADAVATVGNAEREASSSLPRSVASLLK